MLDKFDWVKRQDAVKFAFPQDEYDHAHILDEWLDHWGVDAIYSVVGHRDVLYPRCYERIPTHDGLTGYVDDEQIKSFEKFARPFAGRTVDVGYRARQLPAYFGRHGQQKSKLTDVFGPVARAKKMNADVSNSPDAVLLDDDWLRFLGNSKFTLGSEGGSSVLDPRGEIQDCCRAMVEDTPNASFEEIEKACFPDTDCKYVFSAISPRLFEVAAAKSCQVLIEGEYLGVLQPGREYIAVKPDFSNVDQVLDCLADDDAACRMIEACYEKLIVTDRYRYSTHAKEVIARIEKLVGLSPAQQRNQDEFNATADAQRSAGSHIAMDMGKSKPPPPRNLATPTETPLPLDPASLKNYSADLHSDLDAGSVDLSGTHLSKLAPDSVYFFSWSNFKNELRSNRWYYAKLWSRYLPVVILQPSLSILDKPYLEKVPGLANVSLLHISGSDTGPLTRTKLAISYADHQTMQIGALQNRLGHRRPIFWGYNPNLCYSYLKLPALVRIYHATENYFDHATENYFNFEDEGKEFLAIYNAMICSSDLTISCSKGVAKGLSDNLETINQITVSNGCDFDFFSTPTPPDGPLKKRLTDIEGKGPYAVFAGNVNRRLDFNLVENVAKAFPNLNLLFVGPVEESLPDGDDVVWKRVLGFANVFYIGPVAVEALPYIYSKARFGIIPYKLDRMLVENGFPLKALEMAAAGIRVVSSLMKPLLDVKEAVVVARSNEEFVSYCAQILSTSFEPNERAAATAVCRQYDYATRFDKVMENIEMLVDEEAENFECNSIDPQTVGFKERKQNSAFMNRLRQFLITSLEYIFSGSAKFIKIIDLRSLFAATKWRVKVLLWHLSPLVIRSRLVSLIKRFVPRPVLRLLMRLLMRK